jgi:hypothetical protein
VRFDFGMPLDAQSECGSASDAYRFDRAVLGHPFDDNTIAKLEDGLTMQRVHADCQTTKEPGEYTVGYEPYVMAIREHDLRITMKTSIFCAWRTSCGPEGLAPPDGASRRKRHSSLEGRGRFRVGVRLGLCTPL